MLKCRECRSCNGRACAGEIPGLGGKDTGSSFIRNVEMMQKVRIHMDVCCDDAPIDVSCRILGMDLSMPVMIAPIAGINNNYGADMSDHDYVTVTVEAAQNTGIRAFTGDGINMESMFLDPARVIDAYGGKGIVTMKPWVQEGIDARIAGMKDLKSEAVAMDVDAAGLPFLKNMTPPAGSKTAAELKEIAEMAGRPFIVKGVMTVNGALKAAEAGAYAIVVSNHGGRVLDQCAATAEVLCEIADAVKGKTKILVDGGIRTGTDVFKALAMGADGVLICRPFVTAVYGGGIEGVKCYIDKLAGELKDTMAMCGAHSLEEITGSMIRK